jgi:hypothetical protein
MKHLIFTLVLFFIAGNLLAQEAPKVDTIVTQTWDGSAWVNDIRSAVTYDASCRPATILLQEWDVPSQTWVNTTLSTNTYGSGDVVTESITQTWDGSTWVNAIRNTYTYDASFKLLSTTLDQWDGTAWQLFIQTTYTYDASGYKDSVLTQIALFGPLQNSTLDIYDNNSDGTADTVVTQTWDFLNNVWNNGTRTSYTYNADKTVNQSVTENWNLLTSTWDLYSRNTNTYDASGRLLTTLTEAWQSTAWVNSSLSTNTYDVNGHLVSTLDQTWNATTSLWENETFSTYSYTTACTLPLKLISFTASKNKNIVTLNWQTAEEINTSHFNIQRSTDGVNFGNVGNVTAKGSGGESYRFADNIDNIQKDKVYYRLQLMDKDGKYSFSKIIPLALDLFAGNIKTYPNPVKDQLYILFNAQTATKATICISDAAGKIVHTETVSTSSNAINVNVSRLGKGIYYVQLITDKGVQRTTFMKQ